MNGMSTQQSSLDAALATLDGVMHFYSRVNLILFMASMMLWMFFNTSGDHIQLIVWMLIPFILPFYFDIFENKWSQIGVRDSTWFEHTIQTWWLKCGPIKPMSWWLKIFNRIENLKRPTKIVHVNFKGLNVLHCSLQLNCVASCKFGSFV